MQTSPRLVIVRHAEAGWEGSASDHERPLTEHGTAQASRLGLDLAAMGWLPEVVVHSSAQRAVRTWVHMADPLGDPAVFVDRALYHEGPAAYLEAAARHGGGAGTVLLVGHNPVVGELVDLLCSQRLRFGTAHAALLELRGGGAWPGWRIGLAVPVRFRLVKVLGG